MMFIPLLLISSILVCLRTYYSFHNSNFHKYKYRSSSDSMLMAFTSRKKINQKNPKIIKPTYQSEKLMDRLPSNSNKKSSEEDKFKGQFIERIYKNKDRVSLSTLVVGHKYKGRIISFTNFGMYVDIGTKGDGLVHVKDMSKDYFIHDFKQLYEPGQDIEVYIKFIDISQNKYGLSLFAPTITEEPPSYRSIESLSIGEQIDGKVVRVSEFGVYVDIGVGSFAFLHKRKMRIGKSKFNLKAWEICPMGSSIKGYVLNKNVKRFRVELTTYKPEEWEDKLPIKSEDDEEDDFEELGGNSRASNILARRMMIDNSLGNDIDDDIEIDDSVDINELITNDFNAKKFESKNNKINIDNNKNVNDNFEENLMKYLKDDLDDDGEDDEEDNITLDDDVDDDDDLEDDGDDESFNLIEELSMEEIKQIEEERRNSKLDELDIDSYSFSRQNDNDADDLSIEELFDYISNNKQSITLKDLKKWDYIQDLIESNEISNDTISNIFKRSGSHNGLIDVDGFAKFIDLLSDHLDLLEIYENKDEIDDDDDDDTSKAILIDDTTNDIVPSIDSKLDSKLDEIVVVNELDESNDDEVDLVIDSRINDNIDDNDINSIIDNSINDQSKTSLSELYSKKSKTNDIFLYVYNNLSKKKGYVDKNDIMNWEFVTSLINNHNIDNLIIESMYNKAYQRNKNNKLNGLDILNFEYFVDLISNIDVTDQKYKKVVKEENKIDNNIDNKINNKSINVKDMKIDNNIVKSDSKLLRLFRKNKTNKKDNFITNAIDNNENDNRIVSKDVYDVDNLNKNDDNDESNLLQSVFTNMANGKSYLSIKDLLDWDFVLDLIMEGVLTEETLEEKILKYGGNSKGIKLDGFDKLLDDLVLLYKDLPDYFSNESESNVIPMNNNNETNNIDENNDNEGYDNVIDVDSSFEQISQGKEYITLEDIKNWRLINEIDKDKKVDDVVLQTLLLNAGIDDVNIIDISSFEDFLYELSDYLSHDSD